MRTIWKGLAHELRNVKISHTLGLYIPGLLFTSSHPLYAHEAPLLVHCWIRMASEYSPRSRCSCQFLDPWKRWKRLGECTKNSKFQIFQMWNLVLKNISNITIITTSIYPTMSAHSPNRPQHWFINNTNNRHHINTNPPSNVTSVDPPSNFTSVELSLIAVADPRNTTSSLAPPPNHEQMHQTHGDAYGGSQCPIGTHSRSNWTSEKEWRSLIVGALPPENQFISSSVILSIRIISRCLFWMKPSR